MKRLASTSILILSITASVATESATPASEPSAGVFGSPTSVFIISDTLTAAPDAIAATDYYEVVYLSEGSHTHVYELGVYKATGNSLGTVVDIVEDLTQTGGMVGLTTAGFIKSLLWDGFTGGTLPQSDNYPTGDSFCDLTMDAAGNAYFAPHGYYVSTLTGTTSTLWRDEDPNPGPGSTTSTWISVELASDSCADIAWDGGSVFAWLGSGDIAVYDESLNPTATLSPSPWCVPNDMVAVGGYVIVGGTDPDSGDPCLEAFDPVSGDTVGYTVINLTSVSALDVLVDSNDQAWVYFGGLSGTTPYLGRVDVNDLISIEAAGDTSDTGGR